MNLVIAFIISLVMTVISTPIMMVIAVKLDIVDRPTEDRKIHKKAMPYLGGIAIAIGFFSGFLYLHPFMPSTWAFVIGALLLIITGVIDDKISLSPRLKLMIQIIAAVIVTVYGVKITSLQLPHFGYIQLGWFSYPLTILWIVGLTNAMNLIDGLDGLASGVSSIALGALLVMGILNYQTLAISLSVMLLGGTLGFLFFNVHPAKIFMGDAGSMFIGYIIAVISILGLFKSITFFSVIIPIVVLAVPIFDTSFAIIRRALKHQKLSAPDKGHLHHCLMELGFSHGTTVYIIFLISLFFGIAGVIFSRSILWGSIIILLAGTVMIRFSMEMFTSFHSKKPLVNAVKRLVLQHSKSKG
ncbi:MraY family glycosyltransferase [Pullulanibacillus sp. KACC 23026]|uniref:MraY family glycosyltransferase n=1 Tax=Pullulanibacillus sp. KACC 23026 TaxID=3028315 RepID=UPI0023B01A50|nr:MraY family glycosyltransferase [Pullulanibacillus sp. KACC 23026]WEG13589.1 MraY family glycosyltransferase [Pullulanibacillus sp. KACC 23026]